MNRRINLIAGNPQDGTSFYRAFGPFTKLKGVDLLNQWDINWPTLSSTDIVFLQRPIHQLTVRAMKAAQAFNKPVWCDWDDDGFHLDETNPAFEFYDRDEKQAALRELLRLADICTVSTPHLKEVFLKEVPSARIEVVPNAVDDSIFSLKPSTIERNKIIAIRGASSHEKDWAMYRDGILQLAKMNPEWTWAIMGYHPTWMNEIENVRLYEFADIPYYFEKLMELRPALAIVPLEDSLFNRSKSAIGFYEMTLAGACVAATHLPEFHRPGCVKFRSNYDLLESVQALINNPQRRQRLYTEAIYNLPKLSEVNEKRLDIIEQLVSETKKYKPLIKEVRVLDDKEFHEFELANGLTPDEDEYKNLHEATAKWLIKTYNPKSTLELGCGVGGILLELLKNGVNAYGIEKNRHSVAYFKERNPVFQNQIIEEDITNGAINLDQVGELVYSIECFEHINMPEEWWNKFLNDLSYKFKNFYFTSTPFYTTESFDKFWGHSNIRVMSKWKELFEKNGWEFTGNPKAVTAWDMTFKSKNISQPNGCKLA